MKLISHRQISRQLLFLQLLVVATIILIAYLFRQGIYDYAIFSFVLIVPTCVITLTQVNVYDYKVNIIKYSLFGLITKTIDLNDKNILAMTNYQDLIDLDDTGIYESENPISFMYIFLPKTSLPYNQTEFQYTDQNNETKSVTVKLKTKEYKLVWDTLNRKMH